MGGYILFGVFCFATTAEVCALLSAILVRNIIPMTINPENQAYFGIPFRSFSSRSTTISSRFEDDNVSTTAFYRSVTVQILCERAEYNSLSLSLSLSVSCLLSLSSTSDTNCPSTATEAGGRAGTGYDVTQSPELPDRACADNGEAWQFTAGQRVVGRQCPRHGCRPSVSQSIPSVH